MKEEIVEILKHTRKYRHVHDMTLMRIVDWALARYKDRQEVIKHSKRKLHQVYGAFFRPATLGELIKLLEAVQPELGEDEMEAICLQILRLHQSTAERIPILDRIYHHIFAVTGEPRLVLDLACGLNPFTLPWMKLGPGARYEARDINTQLMELTDQIFKRLALPHVARCEDIFEMKATVPFDVAFLFKTLPTLEQQEKGSGRRLIEALPARYVVVSYPLVSLSGRGGRMKDHYTNSLSEILAALSLNATQFILEKELFFVIDKNGAPSTFLAAPK